MMSHPDCISIVHGQNAHIIHTADDYDVIKEGDKTSLHLKKTTCLELAKWGIFHHWHDMTDAEREDFDARKKLAKGGLLLKSGV